MIFDTDLRFGDWERGLLDVMTPDGEGPFPVVVCVHGGGWRFGVKDDMHPYAEWLLPLGIASVLPNYRLSDEAIHPAQQDDVIAALNWIANNANEYHFDVDRTGLTGVSAGGHLSAQVGCLAKERAPRVRVRCMYPVCPPTNFPQFVADNPGIGETIEQFLGANLADLSVLLKDASPVTHVHSGAPACRCVHGDLDNLVPPNQSRIFVEALRGVGVEADVLSVPNTGHAAFQPNVEPLEPLGGIESYLAFFRKHLIDAD